MSANLSLHPGNAQWIGQRAEQQDAFGFLGCEARGGRQTGDVLVVLADGMGGLQRGGEASRLAVRTFLDHFAQADPSTTTPITETLSQALDVANRAVNALARDTDDEGDVGTTLIAAAVREGRLHWIGVGDSRLYLYRAADGSLTACNDPHNLEQQLWPRVINGELTPDDIATHPDRDALTSFLGLPEIPEIDASLRPLPLEPGDRLLLCSDGVDGVLTRDELRSVLPGDPQHAAETLIARLREHALAYQDNATVAILACESSEVATAIAAPKHRRRLWLPAFSILVGVLLTGVAFWFKPWAWLDADSVTAPEPTATTPAAPAATSEPEAPSAPAEATPAAAEPPFVEAKDEAE